MGVSDNWPLTIERPVEQTRPRALAFLQNGGFMKKTVKNLKLAKETLYGLDHLKEVVGGVTAGVACNSTLCTKSCTGSHNTCTSFLC